MNNLKHCPLCELNKEHREFGTDKRTKDGLTNLCLICKDSESKIGTLRRLASKEEKLSPRISEEDVEISKKMIARVTPIYQYLINLSETDGVLKLPKSMSEIVDFFGFKPRIGIDLIHSYIHKNSDTGYTWEKKPESAKQVAKYYASLINLKSVTPTVTNEILYEQFILMREELAELTYHLTKLTIQFKD